MMGFMLSEQNAEIDWTSMHIATMGTTGLGEDESLSGALLRAAGRATSTQPAAIHSTATLPSPPDFANFEKKKGHA